MIFYVQQVYADKASRRHEVILDVAEMETHLELERLLGAPDRAGGREDASMLSFSYMPDGPRGLKEGSWYDIDPAVFAGVRYEAVGPDGPGGAFLRGALGDLEKEVDFAAFLTAPRAVAPSAVSVPLVVQPAPAGDIELTVVDCGHGNWNEIATANDRLLYDAGASRRFNAAQVRAVVGARKLAAETRPITVVISHWDVDHYQALLQFTPAELKKLRAVFVPSQVPDTETYKRVQAVLTSHKVPLVTLAPARRSSPSRQIDLAIHSTQGAFTLFRATPGRSRNQTGIVLGVRGNRRVALLTGDHHYNKLIAAASGIAAYQGRDCVLVTPHHGGHAGTLDTATWLKCFPSLTTPLSCGANSDDHPYAELVAELSILQRGPAPRRTDYDGNLSYVL